MQAKLTLCCHLNLPHYCGVKDETDCVPPDGFNVFQVFSLLFFIALARYLCLLFLLSLDEVIVSVLQDFEQLFPLPQIHGAKTISQLRSLKVRMVRPITVKELLMLLLQLIVPVTSEIEGAFAVCHLLST